MLHNKKEKARKKKKKELELGIMMVFQAEMLSFL